MSQRCSSFIDSPDKGKIEEFLNAIRSCSSSGDTISKRNYFVPTLLSQERANTSATRSIKSVSEKPANIRDRLQMVEEENHVELEQNFGDGIGAFFDNYSGTKT